MASATFDKSSYRFGDAGVLTVDYSDVPDGVLSFTGSLTPGGGGTPIPFSASAPVEAAVTGAVKLGGAVITTNRADDPATNRVTFTFTV